MTDTPLALAGCIVPDGEGRILLIHRHTPGREQWEIPGGKIHQPAESPRSATVREMSEELGVKVAIIGTLGSRDFVEGDHTMNYTWLQARIVEGIPHVCEPETHDRFAFFPIDALAKSPEGLSPNTVNFLREYASGRITLADAPVSHPEALAFAAEWPPTDEETTAAWTQATAATPFTQLWYDAIMSDISGNEQPLIQLIKALTPEERNALQAMANTIAGTCSLVATLRSAT